MRTIVTALLLIAIAAGQQVKVETAGEHYAVGDTVVSDSPFPQDLEFRVFTCSTERHRSVDKNGTGHYHFRADLHGSGPPPFLPWERTLGWRTTEKQATRDCQLWQEAVNNLKLQLK